MKNKYEQELISLGSKIKQLRVDNKITQQTLAYNCDVDIRTIQRIEKGIHNPTYKILLALSESFNIEISQLLII